MFVETCCKCKKKLAIYKLTDYYCGWCFDKIKFTVCSICNCGHDKDTHKIIGPYTHISTTIIKQSNDINYVKYPFLYKIFALYQFTDDTERIGFLYDNDYYANIYANETLTNYQKLIPKFINIKYMLVEIYMNVQKYYKIIIFYEQYMFLVPRNTTNKLEIYIKSNQLKFNQLHTKIQNKYIICAYNLLFINHNIAKLILNKI